MTRHPETIGAHRGAEQPILEVHCDPPPVLKLELNYVTAVPDEEAPDAPAPTQDG